MGKTNKHCLCSEIHQHINSDKVLVILYICTAHGMEIRVPDFPSISYLYM